MWLHRNPHNSVSGMILPMASKKKNGLFSERKFPTDYEYGHENRILWNAFKRPQKTAQNGHFWACRPQILYFLMT